MNYDILTGETFPIEDILEVPGLKELPEPSFSEIFAYAKYVSVKSKMEPEIPIISLIYMEKFLRTTGVLINAMNWQRILLITLCIGSKIWDDDSLENCHFPKVMPDITMREIAAMEKVFLKMIEFDVLINGA